jgi:predicted transcriptional regulator
MRLNRKRQDLVSFNKINNLKNNLNIKAKDIADLLGVSKACYHQYKDEGHLPIFRFQSLVNALRLAIIEEQQDKLKLLDSIINQEDI